MGHMSHHLRSLFILSIFAMYEKRDARTDVKLRTEMFIEAVIAAKNDVEI